MQGTITISGSVGNVVANGSVVRSGTGQGGVNLSGATALPVAQAGSLTTRTDDADGIIMTTNDPTVVQTDKVAVSWAGGTRINMAVTNVAGKAVTVSGGDGDVLPAGATAMTIGKATKKTIAIIGDNVALLFAVADKKAVVGLYSGADALLLKKNLAARGTFLWAGADPSWSLASIFGGTNPLAGVTVGYLVVGSADVSGAAQFSLGFLDNG